MFAKQVFLVSNKAFASIVARRMQHNVALKPAAANTDISSVTIDVPWGKIEGKLWGNCEKQPILAVHGWLDNAGSFDMVAPLLKNSSILAIDMPGHGLSSWLPKGIPYNEDMYTMTLRAVVKALGWEKVKLLGHSLGAIMCHNYTRLYPNEVEFVVSIDAISFMATNVVKHSKRRAAAIDYYIEFQKTLNNSPPSYPEDIAIEKSMTGSVFKTLDYPSAKALLVRGAKQKEDGTYYYSHDSCLKIEGFNSHYTLDYLKEMASLITCPYLIIRASQSPFKDDMVFWSDVIGSLRKSSPDCRYVQVEGTHHLHMLNPEPVANQIIPFLEKYDV